MDDLDARLYRSIYRIRRVEEEVARVYPTDKIKSPVHLSIGQEAVAVAVCDPMRADDVLFGTYRSHAFYLAKGGDLRAMIAELYGKVTGCAKGKGGSMHLIDAAHGVMGSSAIVATTIPHACGYAYAMRYQKRDRAVVSVFGDGAVEEGAFHESMNFAMTKRLPVIFVCENNGYAVNTPFRTRQAKDNVWQRAASYGMPSDRVEDGDVHAMRSKIAAALVELRQGAPGPWFFEFKCYRWKEHVGPNDDWNLGYRSKDELKPWLEHDAVRTLGAKVADRARIDAEVETEIKDAFEFAERSPEPPLEDLYEGVTTT